MTDVGENCLGFGLLYRHVGSYYKEWIKKNESLNDRPFFSYIQFLNNLCTALEKNVLLLYANECLKLEMNCNISSRDNGKFT